MKAAPKGKKPAPAEKAPEKKPKKKARGNKGDSVAALKRFAIEHIEKVVLGGIALVALMLIYAGFRSESLKDTPETVKAAINSANSKIVAPTWDSEKSKRYPEPDQFDKQATEDVISLDVAAYGFGRPFHQPLQERRRRRIDPALLAPVEIEVRSGYGAIPLKVVGGGSERTNTLTRANQPGTRPIPDTMTRDSGRGERMSAAGAKLESRYFVAITALMPYKQQFNLYQEAFKDADAYDPERDLPRYTGLMVERAEVQADGTLGPWTSLDTKKAMSEEPARWESPVEEIASRDYVMAGLAMRIPPMVGRDPRRWALHSKVPSELSEMGEGGRGEGARAEGRAGEAGMDEGARRGEGGVGDAGLNFGEKRVRSEGLEESETRLSEGERAISLLKADVAHVRYFDLTAQPGKVYQYRLRAYVEDPNNPAEGNRPPNSACETEVVLRRQADPDNVVRLTEWSASSTPVAVNPGYQMFAGEITQPRVAGNPGPGARYRIDRAAGDEPTGRILAMTWKVDGPFDVPIPLDAKRGSIIHGTMDVEAIDPTINMVVKLEKYAFTTDAMVVDQFGGFVVDREGLTSPGYVLAMAPDGTLEVRSEFDDVKSMTANFIPPEEEATSEGGMMEGERGREGEGERSATGRGRPNRRPGRGAGRASERGAEAASER